MEGNHSEKLQSVLRHSREEAGRLGHNYIFPEHLLLGIVRHKTCGARDLLEEFNVNLEELKGTIIQVIGTGKSILYLGHIIMTTQAHRVLEQAGQEAKLLGSPVVDTEHLLMALIKNRSELVGQILATFDINYEVVRAKVQSAAPRPTESAAAKPAKSKGAALRRFGRNLTQMASEGLLDPIIGREKEIDRLIAILTRRKKNNPVIIGEPGVGKTALVEGLAQAIAANQAPPLLQNKQIIQIDLTSMVAGTKYRGQFEQRMKAVIEESARNPDIVLFIDEMHTIIGTGSAEGTLDASNILKPALSRGTLRCIGATTLREYRRHIETDGALERRFQTIFLDPPTATETLAICMGLAVKYETHHQVQISPEAVEAAVTFSDRYLTAKFQPDKTLDLIDEACALTHLERPQKPEDLLALEAEIAASNAAKGKAIDAQRFEEAATHRDRLNQLRRQLRDREVEWTRDLERVRPLIGPMEIARVITRMTGIPLEELQRTDRDRLLNMEALMRTEIVGQEEALSVIARAIRRNRAGVGNPRRPTGSFLFLGPSGVGKTLAAQVLARFLFGTPEALIRIDMSEYMERFNVSRLIGSPPGYVGHDEGGMLTEQVRRKPYAVILLDEMEKAHPEVANLLLQILDDGRLTDSLGHVINFRNTVVVMTSNVGGGRLVNSRSVGFGGEDEVPFEEIKRTVLAELKTTFPPELLNRIDETVVFFPLPPDVMSDIVAIQIRQLNQRLEPQGITLTVTPAGQDLLARQGYSPSRGARPLLRILREEVEDRLARLILAETSIEDRTVNVEIDAEEDEITLRLLNPVPLPPPKPVKAVK